MRQEVPHSAATFYRPDIDGLRAIAVGAVVIYHASRTALPGGYLGVDIFFVISGFLITSILRKDIDRRRFSLAEFYRRRVRRILPAYTAAALVVTLVALLMLPPLALKEFGEYLTASATFTSNLWFREHSDYFGTRAENLVLLHTWSLSVEEQFYIFWPIGLWLLSRTRLIRLRMPLILAGVALGLAGSLLLGAYRPEAAFYYFPARAWELLAGAAIALTDWRPAAAPGRALSLAGLALIALALLAAPALRAISPGVEQLPACFGALCLLLSGGRGDAPADRLLYSKPFVWLGLISYSLYLWHWPVFVFVRMYLGHNLDLIEAAGCIALSVLLAFASWRLIEQPFRKPSGPRRPVNLYGLAAIGCVAVIGLALTRLDGLPQRTDPNVIAAEASTQKRWRLTDDCLIDASSFKRPNEQGCRFGDPAKAPSVVLWGDSHANHFGPALEALGQAQGFSILQLTKQSCAPIPLEADPKGAGALNKTGRACADFRAWTRARILGDSNLNTIVIAGRWPRGDQWAHDEALDDIVRALSVRGKRIVLAGTTPEFLNGGGQCVLHQFFLQRDGHACDIAAAPQRISLARVDRALETMRLRYAGVSVFRPLDALCDAKLCTPLSGGVILVADAHHLTIEGARAMAPGLDAAMRRALVAPVAAMQPAAPEPRD